MLTEILGDLPFGQKHLEHIAAKDHLQVFRRESRNDPEHAVSVKTAVRAQDVTAGGESYKIAECLDGDHRPGHGAVLWYGVLKKRF